jgi:NADPH-dependent 2,4-dienoyl-CoA reductase/sulfur reductase-like enzyme
LIKGSFSKDGRLICPWHGACFNAATGDIEDGPALDSLHCFNVRVQGNDVIVSADAALIKATNREPTAPDTQLDRVAVVVGGGPAGLVAAETLRSEGYGGRVILISRENYLPIDRIKLTKGLGFEASKLALRKREFFDRLKIEVMLGTSVTSVDRATNKVTLDNGSEMVYDHLVLATGGTPRKLTVPGNNLGNVFTLRTVEDTHAIGEAVESFEAPHMVIVGSSFIGMELAAVLSGVDDGTVSVIGMEKVPFERVLGLEIGAALHKLHASKGIQFHLSAVVSHFAGDEQGRVTAVHLQDGTIIPANVVVLGVGVVPDTAFLKGQFDLEQRDGSLRVDEYMRVVGTENVYAVGDIATFPYFLNANQLTRIEHWDVAHNQGRNAALNIVHGNTTPFKKVPYFWTAAHGKNLRYCGNGFGYDSIYMDGDVDALVFAAYYIRGDSVLAVATLGRDPLASHCSELFRVGKMPSAAEITSGKDLLAIVAE